MKPRTDVITIGHVYDDTGELAPRRFNAARTNDLGEAKATAWSGAGSPPDPWTWQIAELFRIENGLIRQIEAILIRAPYGMNSGWSAWEDGMSSVPRDVTRD